MLLKKLKYPVFIFLCLTFVTTSAQYFQTVEEMDDYCGVLGFMGDTQAEEIVDRIIEDVGLPFRNFVIQQCKGINNAIAINLNGPTGEMERFILYDGDFFTQMEERSNNDWASVFILAHEIGHHLNGHTLTNKGSNHKWELEADYFAGNALAKMGASLEGAQSAVQAITYEKATRSHPAKADRLNIIKKGWRKGKGIDTTMTEAEKLRSRGNTIFEIGELNYSLKKFHDAYMAFENCLRYDQPDAYFFLSWLTYTGLGAEKDQEKAIELAKTGYEKGSIPCTYLLAYFYNHARGSLYKPQDAQRLFKKNFQLTWFKDRFQKTENELYAFTIGYMYLHGYGGAPKDLENALKWMTIAAEKDNPEGQVLLSGQYYKGSSLLQQSDQKAFYWMQRAAETKYAYAQLRLGLYYLMGKGVTESASKAAHYFELAAKQGEVDAMAMFGQMQLDGDGVQQDIDSGLKWLANGAEEGSRLAQFYLGEVFFLGRVVEQDYEKAFFFYGYAAKNGDHTAQYRMGQMLEEGLGMEKDLDEAIQWYQKSARQNDKKAQKALQRLGRTW